MSFVSALAGRMAIPLAMAQECGHAPPGLGVGGDGRQRGQPEGKPFVWSAGCVLCVGSGQCIALEVPTA